MNSLIINYEGILNCYIKYLPIFSSQQEKYDNIVMISPHLHSKNKYNMIPDYKNPELTVDKRVADLVQRMTLVEKVAQRLCIWKEKDSILFDSNGVIK